MFSTSISATKSTFCIFFYVFFSGNHLEVNNAKQRNGYDHLTRDKFNQSRNEFTNFNQSCLNTPAAAYNYNQLNLNAHAWIIVHHQLNWIIFCCFLSKVIFNLKTFLRFHFFWFVSFCSQQTWFLQKPTKL